MEESMKTPCREKYWSEIDEAEKCERMRYRVKQLERSLGSLRSQMSQVLKHQHGDFGILLIPIASCGGEPESSYYRGQKADDDVYF